MRDVLAHRIEDGMEIFSVLSSMTFKSEEHAISSILIHEITSQAGKCENEEALADLICDILSQQWNRCLKEEVVCSYNFLADKVHSSGIYSVTIELPSPSMLYDM